MKVFRLENNEGLGVYHDEDLTELIMDAFEFIDSTMSPKHPLPYEDSLFCDDCERRALDPFEVKMVGKWRFAFASMESLRAWFYKDSLLSSLGGEGVMLSVYDVPDAIIGNTQVAFSAEFHDSDFMDSQYDLEELVAKKFDFSAVQSMF